MLDSIRCYVDSRKTKPKTKIRKGVKYWKQLKKYYILSNNILVTISSQAFTLPVFRKIQINLEFTSWVALGF